MNERERDLVALAATLPREVQPPPEAWAGIRAQLGGSRELPIAQRPVPYWQHPRFLAAAAVILIAASSSVTAVLIRTGAVRATGGGAPEALVHEPGAIGPAAALAAFTVRENDYLQMVNTLVAAIEDGSNGLSPETIAIIRANLLVIDSAILDARRALAEDPANRRLVDILTSTYEKKLDLLRRTTAMARSS